MQTQADRILYPVPASWKFLHSGKVREIYQVSKNELAIVASDRVSAFDWILPDAISDKGKILCQISRFWFGKTQTICANHWLESQESSLPKDVWARTMLARKAEVYPFEFIVRGYLAGSIWKAYQKNNGELQIGDCKLEKGLKFGGPIPGGPILTPTTKEKTPGKHDEDVPWSEVDNSLGSVKAGIVREAALKIFTFAHDYLEKRDLVMVDTKMEFGELENGAIVLVDELLTPDSSRFWWKKDYDARDQKDSIEPLDKQVIRNYLEKDLRWDKKPPVPRLSSDVISKARSVYIEAFRAITGKDPIL